MMNASVLGLSTATTAATVSHNASMAGLNSFMSVGGTLLIAGVIVALAGIMILLANPKVFKFFQGLWARLRGTGELFLYGICGYAAITVIGTPVYLLSRETAEGNLWPLATISIAIAGYAVTAGFGWLVKNWWLKVKRNSAMPTPFSRRQKVTA